MRPMENADAGFVPYEQALAEAAEPVRQALLEGDFSMTDPLVVQIRPSLVEELRVHGWELFQRHAKESEPEMAEWLSPRWDRYFHEETYGRLIVLGAWAPSGDLVGYVVAALFESPRYDPCLVCQQDIIYVAPEWRGKSIGARLVKRLQTEARERGCHQLLLHAKLGSDLLRLYELMGLQPEEVVFKETLCQQSHPS